MPKCPFCQTDITAVYFSTVCPSCGKMLHTCRSCEFYSPGSHYDCKESVDELVQDKDRPNYCDFFRLTSKSLEKKDNSSKAEDLFNSFFKV